MRLLVIRTSAMGDVALVTPVLREMKKKYPDTEIVLLTRSAFKPFFDFGNTLSLFAPDFKKRHKGLPGIFRLYRDIRKQGRIDHVIDLHDVIRSKVLRLLFRFSGVPVSVIDKGRGEKRDLISGKRKVQLKHTVARYCDVFSHAGFSLDISERINIIPSVSALERAKEITGSKKGIRIGVAPFAKHKLKSWPVDSMISLLNMIKDKREVQFFFFGGVEESENLKMFIERVEGSVSLAGKISLEEELAVMSSLDLMFAMDSSNMHMAALSGVKVISIWGGTDPLNGFGAWMQPESYSISIPVDQLTCRPCTVFGKGECRRGDFACMNWLTPEMVFRKITDLELL
jgi:ADP-heptose:LPS heptosyltransferase